MITGRGLVPISTIQNPQKKHENNTAQRWKESELTATGTELLSSMGDEDSMGLRLAATRLSARDKAQLKLLEKAFALKVDSETTLQVFAHQQPTVERALLAAVDTASEKWENQKGKESVEVTLTMNLDAIAEAVAASYVAAPTEPMEEVTNEETSDRIRRETQAQREALKQARLDLSRQIQGMKTKHDESLSALLKIDPIVATEAIKVIQSARTVKNERTMDDEWVVELEVDTAPILRAANERKEK